MTGPAVIEPVRVESAPAAPALTAAMRGRMPGGALPPEGYLLETGPAGAVLVAADAAGERRARQTLRQLAGAPAARIADWPVMAWRGLHVLDSGPQSLPALKRLIHEALGRAKCNVLVYEIDYNFAFVSHPEMAAPGAWTVAQIRELAAACREEGIRLIPELQCLGHQSWRKPPGALLVAHPEFEEPSDQKSPQSDLSSEKFYCRSWCPSHPKVHAFIADLMDELIDAFQTDAFHVGMDEVFLIGSANCPRCGKLNPADLYAHAVNDLHDHLHRKGITMLMWGDRLLDGKATGYGDWEGATNGTAPAIDRIPKDIIICDWHYDGGVDGKYPSLKIFTDRGFRVWPTVFKNLDASLGFLKAARETGDPNVLGALASVWYPAGTMAATLFRDGAVPPPAAGGTQGGAVVADAGDSQYQIAATALADLSAAWNPVQASPAPASAPR